MFVCPVPKYHKSWSNGAAELGSLSKSLRRPLIRRPEVKKPRNDAVRMLGNDLSPNPTTWRAVFWRSRYYVSIKVDCSSIFTINGFNSYQRLFFTFSRKYSRLLVFPLNVFLAFSQFEISILKRVCHEFYAAPWPQKIRQYKQRLDENRKHDC